MTLPLTPTSPFTDDQSVVTAATLNAWRTAISQALDGVAGGAYTPTSKVQIGGSGLEITEISGAAKSVQLASRARTILHNIECGIAVTETQWSYDLASGKYVWRNIADAAAEVHIPLLGLPNGQVLNTVSVRYMGASGGGGHTGLGGLPNPMPKIQVFKVDVNGTATALAAATDDTSGDIATFEAEHSITTGALAHTIDRTTYSYRLVVTSEGATKYLANGELHGCASAVTITSLPEFGG